MVPDIAIASTLYGLYQQQKNSNSAISHLSRLCLLTYTVSCWVPLYRVGPPTFIKTIDTTIWHVLSHLQSEKLAVHPSLIMLYAFLAATRRRSHKVVAVCVLCGNVLHFRGQPRTLA